MTKHPSIAVVIPFFNEARNVLPLAAELDAALFQLGVTTTSAGGGEVLLVDDGSSDGTDLLLEEVCATRTGWRVLRLPTNQGHAAALYMGMRATQAAWIVLLDGDGQNDPADIASLLCALEKGADLVVGVRVGRHDHWGRRMLSRVANTVRNWVLHDGVRDTGCGLKAMRREVVSALLPIRTLYSFIPALAVAARFRVVEVPIHHRPRRAEHSKYSVFTFLQGWPLIDLIGVWWFSRRRFQVANLALNEHLFDKQRETSSVEQT
jgi:dolichol-phosphate mannosyltransferase